MKRYCTFFCFLIFLALLGINVSCSGEDSSDASDPAPQPDPEITIPTGGDQLPVITDAGGEVTLKFTSATNWTLTTNTDWVKTQVSTGKGGEQTVLLTVLPNETPDERQAIVTIQSGNVKRTITITQKQKDALTLTTREQEINAIGGPFSIEVKSNIEFEVQISDETWIHRIENRALETNTLSFQVDINESAEERVGEIVISGEGLKETFTIRQEGKKADEPEKPILNVPLDTVYVEPQGVDFELKVESNIEYTIKSSAAWVKHKMSQQTGADKREIFTVDANTSTEPRQATITIAGGGLTRTVPVKQKGKEEEVPDGPTTGGTEDFKEEQENW